MSRAACQSEYGPDSKTVAGSEKSAVGDRACESPQRPVFATQ
jgi:hypothetical protein